MVVAAAAAAVVKGAVAVEEEMVVVVAVEPSEVRGRAEACSGCEMPPSTL